MGDEDPYWARDRLSARFDSFVTSFEENASLYCSNKKNFAATEREIELVTSEVIRYGETPSRLIRLETLHRIREDEIETALTTHNDAQDFLRRARADEKERELVNQVIEEMNRDETKTIYDPYELAIDEENKEENEIEHSVYMAELNGREGRSADRMKLSNYTANAHVVSKMGLMERGQHLDPLAETSRFQASERLAAEARKIERETRYRIGQAYNRYYTEPDNIASLMRNGRSVREPDDALRERSTSNDAYVCISRSITSLGPDELLKKPVATCQHLLLLLRATLGAIFRVREGISRRGAYQEGDTFPLIKFLLDMVVQISDEWEVKIGMHIPIRGLIPKYFPPVVDVGNELAEMITEDYGPFLRTTATQIEDEDGDIFLMLHDLKTDATETIGYSYKPTPY